MPEVTSLQNTLSHQMQQQHAQTRIPIVELLKQDVDEGMIERVASYNVHPWSQLHGQLSRAPTSAIMLYPTAAVVLMPIAVWFFYNRPGFLALPMFASIAGVISFNKSSPDTTKGTQTSSAEFAAFVLRYAHHTTSCGHQLPQRRCGRVLWS